ncbi:peptidoglycan-N-acetylmuramic acid deacetylase [Hathewaya proteolytica DSM 3090]|uniref:Peptidoglycan-N-acetylmuramic acid deacetylase n=1 Tax=Hathewaya proteolytica DSM 3090 TaxID=1121331 RepID=A0A1M6K4C1_9CLOT|nr:delta-lactam-biosynthetic de-N-acetylase [Hathewaya proteolytica]SHJ53834.1 peptidoglycan-N-acetylmuramic acid deacetylase [Hathewaya proteolytica DSM 3090]
MNKRILWVLMTIAITALSIQGCKGNNKLEPVDDNNIILENKKEQLGSEISKNKDTESDGKEEKENNDNYMDGENNQNNRNREKEDIPKLGEEKKEEEKIEKEKKQEDIKVDKTQETSIDNTKTEWWFIRNKDYKTPRINGNLKYNLNEYDAYYVGDVEKKVLYLTFDEGYENGYTSKILDVLKKNQVKATFFVTLPYVEERPDLVKRMEAEGHVIGNHTKSHLSMPDVTSNKQKFENELKSVDERYKEVTGKDMSKYFRPPMGEYSQKSLAMTKEMGYKTIFWSFAYKDWEPTEQPEPTEAKKLILEGMHNGAIFLLHAVSKTNAEILEEIITEAKNQGYEFELLP